MIWIIFSTGSWFGLKRGRGKIVYQGLKVKYLFLDCNHSLWGEVWFS